MSTGSVMSFLQAYANQAGVATSHYIQTAEIESLDVLEDAATALKMIAWELRERRRDAVPSPAPNPALQELLDKYNRLRATQTSPT